MRLDFKEYYQLKALYRYEKLFGPKKCAISNGIPRSKSILKFLTSGFILIEDNSVNVSINGEQYIIENEEYYKSGGF